MKYLTILFLFQFFSFGSNVLTYDEIKSKTSSVKKTRLKENKNIGNENDLKKKLEENQKLLESYRFMVSQLSNKPIIENSLFVGEGDFIGANNKFTLRATATAENAVFVNLHGNDSIPPDAKISCQIFTKFNRICGHCSRLIIDGRGRDINAVLKNRDGSMCVIGNVSDSDEKYLTGVTISQFAQGALALSQSSIPTVGGSVVESSAKNKITQGLINVGDEATEIFKEKMKTEEPIVTLNQNSFVIIEFLEAIDL